MRFFLNLAVVLALIAGAAAHAGTVGSVNGYVRDTNGNAVSAATVRFESPAQIATTHTDAHGYYAILDLTPGLYKLEISQRRKLFVVADGPGTRPWPNLIRVGTTSDVYTMHGADRAPADLLRFIPGVSVPIIPPQRGMP